VAIGIVGKPSGTRIITGSVHYGKLKKEGFNLEHREYPDKTGNRTILIMGQRIKQERIYINAPVEVVKAKVPRKKKVAVVAEA
jgi:hypothetical protein